MTIPIERSLSVLQTRQFLLDLQDSKLTPKVPKAVRLRARELLRHYPTSFYIEEAAKIAPNIFEICKKS